MTEDEQSLYHEILEAGRRDWAAREAQRRYERRLWMILDIVWIVLLIGFCLGVHYVGQVWPWTRWPLFTLGVLSWVVSVFISRRGRK